MATAQRPDVGDVLLVIHDFIARSSDELTLAKGDRVQLLERDDEFGDGWFLGKHLVNGNSGLFPEVYTRPAPRGADAPAPQIAIKPAQLQAPPDELATPTQAKSPQAFATSTEPADSASPPPPIQKAPTNSAALPLGSASTPASATLPTKSPPISSGIGTFARLNPGQDIHVLHETLNVIDEHIDDLRSAPSNGGGSRHANDSGSEYSSHIDNRLSYIAGEETDEEEEGAHSRAEVESWTPDDVAEYLFTSGVEKHHCEVFRDQEISGEVLLAMDQTSLFIKAFDLGSVGRRLKTWHKVKALQDEVNGGGFESRPTTQNYGSEAGSEGGRRTRSRNNTVTGSLSRLPPIDDRPMSQQKRRSIASTPKLEPARRAASPVSPRAILDSPSRANHEKRPSAASVRDLHYSRRHSSSTDFRLPGTTTSDNAAPSPKLMSSGTFPLHHDAAHKKQPSFDRNWTLGSAAASSRPISGTGFLSPEPDLQDSAVDLDRGYFSSVEGGTKARNVLKKRDSLVSHSHNPSYTDEQRVRSATAMARQSRGGSIGSIRLDQMSPAAQKYYGVAPSAAAGDRRRTLSTNTIDSLRPLAANKDLPPTVTKLDTGSHDSLQAPSSPILSSHRLDLMHNPLKMSGLRAISDAVTGQERAKVAPSLDSPLKDSPMQSPARTGSTTPSAGVSFELDSADATKSPGTLATTGSRSSKKKGKKETSAYTRGLLKISPREAMIDADYSGWMKKKSNSLMTTWKPRLFVLKGRRLAYYYSEDDEQEKGLIDISFHRVLPADNERLTGLHATLTGASNTPTMPTNSNMTTIAAADADADTTASSDSIFIFKLVPPRAGLSRAVNFTKPTVHYFAVPNIKQGRFWMAALMKATIDRDDTQPIVTSYQQKTISLAKARQMHHRPPALMNLDEKMELAEKERQEASKSADGGGLGIYNGNREDSAVAGLEKLGLSKADSLSGKRGYLFADNGEVSPANMPQSA